MVAFQTVFDAGFRKAMPNLTKWFDYFRNHGAVVRRFGQIRVCSKALKPAGGDDK